MDFRVLAELGERIRLSRRNRALEKDPMSLKPNMDTTIRKEWAAKRK